MPRKPLRNEIVPVIPHLTAGVGGLSGEVQDVRNDLQRCMDRIETEFPLVQSETLSLWIDGTNGNDANDGSTQAKAVKTLERLKEVLPVFFSGVVVINARGTITLPDYHTPQYPTILSGIYGSETTNVLKLDCHGRISMVLWDGGPDETVHAGPFTADGSGDGYLDLSTATWTVNEFRGYAVEILSGPLAGTKTIIEKNSGTRVNILDNTLGDPGLASFQIIRPTTELTGGYTDFNVIQLGDSSILRFQRMYITGGVNLEFNQAPAAQHHAYVSNVVIDAPFGLIPLAVQSGSGIFVITTGYVEPDDLFTELWGWGGVGICQQAPIPAIWEYGTGVFFAQNSVFPQFGASACTNGPQFVGCKIENLMLYNCQGHWSWVLGPAFWNPALKNKVGGFRYPGVPVPVVPAIEMYCSNAELVGPADVEDSTWGLLLANSLATVSGIDGSSNTLGGCYAHSGSHAWVPPAANGGVIPTLTGNGGTVEISKDGSSQVSTWDAIANKAAVGSIVAVAPGSLLDNETFVLDDGVNPAITFEFQVTGGFVPTGGAVEVVDVTSAVTADDVAAAIADAINNSTGTLDITADTPSGATVPLTNDTPGAAGNVAITETVVDAGFVVTGMAGGQDSTPVSDPEVTVKEYKPYFW